MKALARGYVYWPNMNKQLEELVKSCTKCQLVAKSPRKTKLYSWPIPESPWSRLHIDFAGPINGQHYLILVDAYNKWPEVFYVVKNGRKRQQETDSCISSREDTVVSFRAY